MTDSTQSQNVAGAPPGNGQGMPQAGAGGVATAAGASAPVLERARWRTLPPAGLWQALAASAPETSRSAP